MKTYKVKKGKKNFRPLEKPWPIRKAKGWEVEFEFVPGGWSSVEEWGGDKDRADWQKLKGLTSFFSANNKNSTLAVFRPGAAPGTWEVNAYTNWPGSKRTAKSESLIVVKDGQRARVRCDFIEDQAVYTLTVGRTAKGAAHPFNADNWSREIGTYAGGANNSGGPHGGKAIKDQAIKVTFKVLR